MSSARLVRWVGDMLADKIRFVSSGRTAMRGDWTRGKSCPKRFTDRMVAMLFNREIADRRRDRSTQKQGVAVRPPRHARARRSDLRFPAVSVLAAPHGHRLGIVLNVAIRRVTV